MYVGIDIGASYTKVVIQNSNEMIKLPKFETPNNHSTFLSCIKAVLLPYLDVQELYGISIAVPGRVDMHKNYIICVPNINWLNTSVLHELGYSFNCRVEIINDAKAGAVYETTQGVLKQINHGLYVSCGTGLGGCAIINGRPAYGHSGCAGEFGHMIIKMNGRVCSCGRTGCWEAYASSKALLHSFHQATQKNIPLSTFAKYLEQNDPLCEALFDEFINYFEIGISNLVCIYNPSVIAITGGTIETILCVYSRLKLIMKKKKDVYLNTKLCIASGDAYSGAVGALYNMLRHPNETTYGI